MSARLKRSPCIGICSTTYGDLVCRGCMRFAHEIVQWNGFEEVQREAVWARLLRLRAGAVLEHVRIVDPTQLRSRASALRLVEADTLPVANLAYEVLRRSVANRSVTPADLGLQPLETGHDVGQLYRRIERELFDRSVAQYERDFHVIAQ